MFQLDDGVAIIDPNDEYKVVEVNDLFLKITGYSRDEIIGNNYLTFSGQENNQSSANLILLMDKIFWEVMEWLDK